MYSLIIYADGGCDVQNTKKGGWGIVIYDNNLNFLDSSYGGEKNTTNNRMELQALYETLKYLSIQHLDNKKICLRLDSKYVIGIFNNISIINGKIEYGNSWIGNWIRNNWKKQGGIKNLKLILEIHIMLIFIIKKGYFLIWEHCKAHQGIEGNELADQLATLGRNHIKYFSVKYIKDGDFN